MPSPAASPVNAAPARPNATIAPTRAAALSTTLFVKLILVALFWGGTFVAGKLVAQSMPPMSAAVGRFIVAAALLVIVAWKLEGGLPRLNRSQLLMTAALGFTGVFIYNLCFLGALARIPAGRTALIISLNPIITALAAALIFRERLNRARWAGIAVALCGAAVVITRGDLAGALHDLGASFGTGEILMAVAALSWAAYTLISRKALESLSTIATTTYGILWGLAFLAIGASGEIGAVDWQTLGWPVWASLVYLGAIGTVVAFIWYYQGIRAIGPSRTAVFNNLVPAFGVLLSAVALGEPILISMVVGGALSLLGVSMTNRR